MDGDLTNPALRTIRKILRAADQSGRRLATATGLTPSQLLVLQEIERRRQTTPGAVARILQFGHATVTNILDRLEGAGLVSRRRSEGDKRKVLLEVTAQGQAVLGAAPDLLQVRFRERFGELEAWEQAMIFSALERLSVILDASDIDAAPLIDGGVIDRSV
jgi:DNA-binding MarR family transcriptional regulator